MQLIGLFPACGSHAAPQISSSPVSNVGAPVRDGALGTVWCIWSGEFVETLVKMYLLLLFYAYLSRYDALPPLLRYNEYRLVHGVSWGTYCWYPTLWLFTANTNHIVLTQTRSTWHSYAHVQQGACQLSITYKLCANEKCLVCKSGAWVRAAINSNFLLTVWTQQLRKSTEMSSYFDTL